MSSVLIMVVAFVGYIVAYHTYGKYLGSKIFNLSARNITPSHTLQDGIDYIPTHKQVIFGHHFASIAGTGPIVGPAIAIIWGWVPAMLWIFLGSIFMGAVHDLGTLVLSLRNQGQSMAEITGKLMNNRLRLVFFFIIFLTLLIVIAIFGLIIAILFKMYPESVFPVWIQIVIAVTLGFLVFKRGFGLVRSTAVAVAVMYFTVVMGHYFPLLMPDIAGMPATGVWTIILLIYAFVASTLPVNMLLQPRDYINAWQLFIAMGLLVLGVLVSHPAVVAPAYNPSPEGAPDLFPFLFITIACGAISGFHSLVSGGTSGKQVDTEPDARFVGYGSMLTEALLATVVIIAVAAGIGIHYTVGDGQVLTGVDAWNHQYASWQAADGLGSKVAAFVAGAANMLESLGIPTGIGLVIMGVFVASFAGTTLDTATRIQRYVIAELATDLKVPALSNRYAATTLAVVTAAALAFSNGASGNGALVLWPLFGAINQLLAGLSLLVVSYYLKGRGGNYLLTLVSAVLVLGFTTWAMVLNLSEFLGNGNWACLAIGFVALCLNLWMMVETAVLFVRGKALAAA